MAIEDYFHNTVNVTRNTEVMFSAKDTPFNQSVGTTYSDQDVVVELSLSTAETASFVVTGTLNGVTVTSTISFTPSTSTVSLSSQHFDYISGISSTAGTSATVTSKSMSRLGQPIFSESSLFTGLSVRLDNVRPGSLDLEDQGTIFSDKVICFTVSEESGILAGDFVTNTSNSQKYSVDDVNSYYNKDTYVYSELLLLKL